MDGHVQNTQNYRRLTNTTLGKSNDKYVVSNVVNVIYLSIKPDVLGLNYQWKCAPIRLYRKWEEVKLLANEKLKTIATIFCLFSSF